MAAKKNERTHTSITTLKPSELRMAFDIARTAKKSLMVWGSAGIGKSQIVASYADDNFPIRSRSIETLQIMEADLASGDMGMSRTEIERFKTKILDQDTNLVDIRLSQVEPTDLRGIPVPVTFFEGPDGSVWMSPTKEQINQEQLKMKTSTVWAPPAILDLPADWKGVIFIDEMNQAIPVVQAASYQLFLDRRLGDLVLPKDAFVVAAGNREQDGGVTFKLATPLVDRMVHVELTVDSQEWLEYAMATRRDPDVISFIAAQEEQLNTLSPDDPSICGGASPRSWVAVSDLIFAHDSLRFKSPKERQKSSSQVLHAMIEGTVGVGAATLFRTHREMTCKLPSADEILNGQVLDARTIQNPDVAKYYAICSNLVYRMCKLVEEKRAKSITDEQFYRYQNNLVKFLDTSFGDKDSSYISMAIRTVRVLFSNRIFFHKDHVPAWSSFAAKHASLIQTANS